MWNFKMNKKIFYSFIKRLFSVCVGDPSRSLTCSSAALLPLAKAGRWQGFCHDDLKLSKNILEDKIKLKNCRCKERNLATPPRVYKMTRATSEITWNLGRVTQNWTKMTWNLWKPLTADWTNLRLTNLQLWQNVFLQHQLGEKTCAAQEKRKLSIVGGWFPRSQTEHFKELMQNELRLIVSGFQRRCRWCSRLR